MIADPNPDPNLNPNLNPDPDPNPNQVPKALETKLPAGEWLNAALACCGGKGGGKPGKANGNARDPTNAAAAVVAAKEFAASKLGVELD